MSSIFHSGTFWIGLVVVALLVAAKVVIYSFRQSKKKKQSTPSAAPSQGAPRQPLGLPKFLQFLRSSNAPKQQASPITNVDTKVAPIKPGDTGSRVTVLDTELARVKQALRGNTEASQLELGLITRLTDEVEEIKKALVQWGFLGEPLAEKDPESDKERNAREWRESLVEQVDIWRGVENFEAANVVIIKPEPIPATGEDPANKALKMSTKIAPPRLDTTSAGAQIHARLGKETMATSQVALVPVDGKGLKDTLKELRRIRPNITKEEATATLIKQGFDFKGKNPDLMVRLPWANLLREDGHAEP